MAVTRNKNPIDKAFNVWISQYPESFHWCDMKRFYVLVKTVCRYGRGKTNSSEWLRKKIKDSEKNLSDEDIDYYCELYMTLQEFHKIGPIKLYEIE